MTGILLCFKPLLLLLLLLTAAACTSAVADASCQEKCGNVSIPYPFGIGTGCSRDRFNIICNDTKGDGIFKPYIGNVEVIDISLVQAQMRVFNLIGYACYNRSGYPYNTSNSYLSLFGTPYMLSDTRNKFTAIGCSTLAYIKNPDASQRYMSGCLSICQNESSITDDGSCSGMGCCQTSIPKGLQYYEVAFDMGFNHSNVWDFSPCSYAFMADQDGYRFNTFDVYKKEVFNRNNGVVPVVLDWRIGTEKCEQAKRNLTAYACISQNSDCVDSTNGPGYTCNCSMGYQGNPYVQDGCKDIHECDDPMKYNCYGNCMELPGSFKCSCPTGTGGDAFKEGGCRPKLTLLMIILLAGLGMFFVTAIMYLVYEKAKLIRAKQKCFRQNGGLLLQEQINAHQYLRFKIYTEEEIERATNKFAEDRVKGRGGQGIVYEGVLEDGRKVAVKKAVMIDEKKKKDFAKEMYILSLINHKNVIKILGCCLEVEVPILIYEFICRGTLFDYIQNKNLRMPLGFRLKIAIDSASALAYLHSDASPPIVHGDIKSSNILMDDEYVAKISDFGASQLSSGTNESRVPFTWGYLDPESMITGQLTEKSDVYSFAVVILELLTRKKAVYSEGPREKRSLAQTFKEGGLADILDNEIKHEITREQITEFAELLTVCLREKGEERPTMTKIVAQLRKMREFDQNLSEERNPAGSTVTVLGESNYHSTYTAQYYSSEHQAVFEIGYSLTR